MSFGKWKVTVLDDMDPDIGFDAQDVRRDVFHKLKATDDPVEAEILQAIENMLAEYCVEQVTAADSGSALKERLTTGVSNILNRGWDSSGLNGDEIAYQRARIKLNALWKGLFHLVDVYFVYMYETEDNNDSA